MATVATKAGLSPTKGAFDGDGLSWFWRCQPDTGGTGEARVRVQPDSLNEGVEIEVSAAAWQEQDRQIAASRTISSTFWKYQDVENRESDLTTENARNLRAAWEAAGHLVSKLPDVREVRNKALTAIEEVRRRK